MNIFHITIIWEYNFIIIRSIIIRPTSQTLAALKHTVNILNIGKDKVLYINLSNSVTEAELQQFLKRTPKYATIAAGGLAAAAPFVGLPIAIGGMIGGVLGLLDGSIKAKDIQLEAQDVIKALTDNIGQCTENIKRKQEAIAQLEKEIEAEEAQISALKNTIAQVESHLNE